MTKKFKKTPSNKVTEADTLYCGFDTESISLNKAEAETLGIKNNGCVYSIVLVFNKFNDIPNNRKGLFTNVKTRAQYNKTAHKKFLLDYKETCLMREYTSNNIQKVAYFFIDFNTMFKFFDLLYCNVIIWSENGSSWDHFFLLEYLGKNKKYLQNIPTIEKMEKQVKGFTEDTQIEELKDFYDSDDYNDILEIKNKRILDFYNIYENTNFESSENLFKAWDEEDWKNGEEAKQKQIAAKKAYLLPSEWEYRTMSSTEIKTIRYKTKTNIKMRIKNKQGVLIIFKDIKILFNTLGLANKGNGLTKEFNLKCGLNHQNCLHKQKNELGYTKQELYKNIDEFINDANELEYLKRDGEIVLEWVNLMRSDKNLSPYDWKDTTAATTYNNWINKFGSDQVQNKYNDLLEDHQEDKNKYFIKIGMSPKFKDTFPTYMKYTKKNRNAFNTPPKKKIHQLIKDYFFPTEWLNEKYIFGSHQNYTDNKIDVNSINKPRIKRLENKTLNTTKWSYFYIYHYDGGIVTINKKYKYKIMKSFKIDVNSLYPSVMELDTHEMSPFKNNKVLAPYGVGISDNDYLNLNETEQALYTYDIKQVTLKGDLYHLDNLPFINIKRNGSNTWASKIIDQVGLTIGLDPYQWKAFNNYTVNKRGYDAFKANKIVHDKNGNVLRKYRVKIILIDKMHFKAMPIKEIYGEYINKWKNVKIDSKKRGMFGSEKVSKLMQNGLYGKFAQNPIQTSFYYVDEAKINFNTFNLVNYYLPLGALITSLARLFMVSFLKHDWAEYGIYIDTDSFALKEEYYNYKGPSFWKKWLDEANYSKFKVEDWSIYFMALAPKRYLMYKSPFEITKAESKVINNGDCKINKNILNFNMYIFELVCSGYHENERDPLKLDFLKIVYGIKNNQKQRKMNNDFIKHGDVLKNNVSLRLEEGEKYFIPLMQNKKECLQNVYKQMKQFKIPINEQWYKKIINSDLNTFIDDKDINQGDHKNG